MSRREYKKDGNIMMWVDGRDRLHREGGPAQVTPDGTQVRCRKDGPAYVGSNGTIVWWEYGRPHRSVRPC